MPDPKGLRPTPSLRVDGRLIISIGCTIYETFDHAHY